VSLALEVEVFGRRLPGFSPSSFSPPSDWCWPNRFSFKAPGTPASQHPNIPASQRPSWTLFYFFFNCCTASAGRMVGPLFAGQNVWQMPMPTITRAAISHGCNCDLNSLRCPTACPIVIIIVIIMIAKGDGDEDVLWQVFPCRNISPLARKHLHLAHSWPCTTWGGWLATQTQVKTKSLFKSLPP